MITAVSAVEGKSTYEDVEFTVEDSESGVDLILSSNETRQYLGEAGK